MEAMRGESLQGCGGLAKAQFRVLRGMLNIAIEISAFHVLLIANVRYLAPLLSVKCAHTMAIAF